MLQFYGDGGAPVDIDGDEAEPIAAWRSLRSRMRTWLGGLPSDQWSRPTRCDAWDVAELTRHLVSGAQFLGWTLHQAGKGEATTLLRDFDPVTTPVQTAAMLAELGPAELPSAMADADARIDGAVEGLAWDALAEGPPGHLPAHLAISHFVFDAWVHERDLRLPAGEVPPVDPLEAAVTARYVLAAVGVLGGADVPVDVRLHDLDLRLGLDPRGARVRVTVEEAPSGAAVVEGDVADVVDLATGRHTDAVTGDDAGLTALGRLADLLQG